MIPFADTHVHLLAGLDDGPPTADVALAMCRMLVAEGARHATALAHQNDAYPDNTADRLRGSAAALAAALAEHAIPLAVYPTGEVMLSPTTLEEWHAGTLLSIGDHWQWLLVEMPHSGFVDVLPLAAALRGRRRGLCRRACRALPGVTRRPRLVRAVDRSRLPAASDGPRARRPVGAGVRGIAEAVGEGRGSSTCSARTATASTVAAPCWRPGSGGWRSGSAGRTRPASPASGEPRSSRAGRCACPRRASKGEAGSRACSVKHNRAATTHHRVAADASSCSRDAQRSALRRDRGGNVGGFSRSHG